MDELYSRFWSEHFWLPEGTEWADLRSNGTVNFPQYWELQYAILAGAALLILRILTESFVLIPIGYFSGWMDPKKGGLFTRIWSHLTHGFYGKSKFKAVAETAWRFIWYTSIWAFGLSILINEPYFYDIQECFRDWPHHPISDSIWWYYILSLGFYWSLLVSQFTLDVRRSDFWEMVLHHLLTISLLSMSFGINFIRTGTLILISHDSADIFLELGKLFRYADRQMGEGRTWWGTLLTVDFALLLIVWIGTRLYYFPVHIIGTMIVDGPGLIQSNYQWLNIFQRPIMPRVFLAMFCTLLVLHVFWTVILLKIAWKALTSKGVDDIREKDSDDEFEEDEVFMDDVDEKAFSPSSDKQKFFASVANGTTADTKKKQKRRKSNNTNSSSSQSKQQQKQKKRKSSVML